MTDPPALDAVVLPATLRGRGRRRLLRYLGLGAGSESECGWGCEFPDLV